MLKKYIYSFSINHSIYIITPAHFLAFNQLFNSLDNLNHPSITYWSYLWVVFFLWYLWNKRYSITVSVRKMKNYASLSYVIQSRNICRNFLHRTRTHSVLMWHSSLIIYKKYTSVFLCYSTFECNTKICWRMVFPNHI